MTATLLVFNSNIPTGRFQQISRRSKYFREGILAILKSPHSCLWCMLPLIYASKTWWRHQIEIFSTLLALCVGNTPVIGEFPSQRPVTRSFDVFFDLRLHEWLSKQPLDWWFETPSCPWWRNCKDIWCVYSEHKLSWIRLTFYSVILWFVSTDFIYPEPSGLLQWKCHFGEIFITGCTGSCQNDNFQFSQWWKFRQNDNISVSALEQTGIPITMTS